MSKQFTLILAVSFIFVFVFSFAFAGGGDPNPNCDIGACCYYPPSSGCNAGQGTLYDINDICTCVLDELDSCYIAPQCN